MMNIARKTAAISLGIFFLIGSQVRADTFTFNYTGAYVTWVVPLEVTSITFDLMGANGGDATGGGWTVAGGAGAELTGTLAVTGGSTLYFFVGGVGSNASQATVSGGFNGGGDGSFHMGGAGGGATDIRIGGIALSNRVAVAGGGGGGNTVGGFGGVGGDSGMQWGTLGLGGSGTYGGGGGGYYGGYYAGPPAGVVSNGQGGSNFTDSGLVTNAVNFSGGGGSYGAETNGYATIVTLPEPSSWVLMLAGLGVIFSIRKFRRVS